MVVIIFSVEIVRNSWSGVKLFLKLKKLYAQTFKKLIRKVAPMDLNSIMFKKIKPNMDHLAIGPQIHQITREIW